MASTALERMRALHEDAERAERLAAKDLGREPHKHRHVLAQQHRVSGFVDSVVDATAALAEGYADAGELRSLERAPSGDRASLRPARTHTTCAAPPKLLLTPGARPRCADNSLRDEAHECGDRSGGAFDAFYARLALARSKHAALGDRLAEGFDEAAALSRVPEVEFSGEEGSGRYLDLHAAHREYVNAKAFGTRCEYAAFLSKIKEGGAVALAPRSAKSGAAYAAFVDSIAGYLKDFHARTQPLQPLEGKLAAAESSFEEAWDKGEVAGWEDLTAKAPELPIDLDEHDTEEKLLELGGDALKDALSAVGLKAGGTPQQRAQRLLLLKATPGGLANMGKKHFAKGAVVGKADGDTKAAARLKASAAAEARVDCLLGLLGDALDATLANVEKKATRTYEEMEEERAAADDAEAEQIEEDEDLSSDEEDAAAEIYNPLKLPLGWDGRPIPFWLYKLHGLNQEFKVRECGRERDAPAHGCERGSRADPAPATRPPARPCPLTPAVRAVRRLLVLRPARVRQALRRVAPP